ncbi:MAG TPA: SDR family oxidoreductase [Candidatus Limnocylindrales bacterium]|nr:SDR family oxidoreductase [Candidatus Limnocylindrales bacterium]
MSAVAAPETLAVLVTGATGPSGRAVARRLGADGARIALNGSDPGRLAGLIGSLGLGADRAIAVPGDLTDPEAARVVVATAEAAFGRLDVLVHLVGGWSGGTAVADLDHDEVRSMLDQHLWTTLNTLQAVLPGMTSRGFGRVVALSSPLATIPGPRGAGYAMAKAAEEVLLRSVARETGADGVTANILVIRTLDDERSRAAQPNAKTAGWTTPEELAEAVAWLVSPAAAAVNGQRIPLDGRG